MSLKGARFLLVVSLGLSLFAASPARAANSCYVVATGYPGTPGDCRYVATSPNGTYEVATYSGFIISASSDGGLHYRTLVSHIAHGNDPTSGIAITTGTYKVNVGDIVVAAIALEHFTSPAIGVPGLLPPPLPSVTPPVTIAPPMTFTFQDGAISAGDA